MTRGTMRTLLGRRLQDTANDFWSVSDKNDLLNEGLHLVQKEVMKVDAGAFAYIDKATLTLAGGGFIAKPVGFWYELEVGYKDSTAAGGYRSLSQKPYWFARDLKSSSGVVYAHLGRHFYISPPPTADITDGVQLIYVPTLSMATDTDVPDLHQALHMAVVTEAGLLAAPESGEVLDNLLKEKDRLLGDIPTYYRMSGGEPDKLNLGGLGKNY